MKSRTLTFITCSSIIFLIIYCARSDLMKIKHTHCETIESKSIDISSISKVCDSIPPQLLRRITALPPTSKVLRHSGNSWIVFSKSLGEGDLCFVFMDNSHDHLFRSSLTNVPCDKVFTWDDE